MKVDLKKVMTVSGYSGLYLFISDSKSGMIVEAMADKKRTCMSPRARMTSLAEISVYTESGELRLREVLERMKSAPADRELPDARGDSVQLQKFFEEVIPDYDRDRFYASHMRKILDWFRLLKSCDALDFEEEKEANDNTEKEVDTKKNQVQ